MARCFELSQLTEEPGRITRRFLCEPMHKVHERLAEWMEAIGMEPRVDNAGNLIGRRRSARTQAKTLLVGSHLDSVPGGGQYDGVLGVLIALATCETLAQQELPFHLDVIGFSEEEGVRYSKPYLGSSAVAGRFDPAWLDRHDRGGLSMRDAMAGFGLDTDCIAQSAYDPAEVIGYVEPHLEQGPVLEHCGCPLGVVSGIVGQSRLRVEFVGQAGHAGTTPMDCRCDAMVCAARFIRMVRRIGQSIPDIRATVGQLIVTPNAPNVIPERVEVSLDIRHADDGVRDEAVERCLAEGTRIAKSDNASFRVLEDSPQPAVQVDPTLTTTLAEAAERLGVSPMRLPSGAGHDAVMMAATFPVAMLFVRHPGGVSHHPDERVEAADVALAIDTMGRFVQNLASTHTAPTQGTPQ